MSPTVAAIIAVKNEEHQIQTCLEHLNWVNEIIIIDNGSTDKTVEICKRYTQKIYSHPKKELIPFLQNLGIQKATKDWSIIIDADVIVTEKARNEILQKIKNPLIDGYYLPHRQYFLGKPISSNYFGRHKILKLFKRQKGYFEGKRPHEPLTFHGKTGHIKEELIHYSHPSIEKFIEKMNKYTSEEAKNNKRKITLFTLLGTLVFTLPHYFFLREGYKDGVRGLIYSTLLTINKIIEEAKTWELQKNGQKNK